MSGSAFQWMRVALVAGLAIGAGVPGLAQNHARYSRSELRRVMREAQAAEQYQTLSDWFREEESRFRREADAENVDYERYKNLPIPGKYPTRADSARELRDYYSNKANRMAALAGRYEAKASALKPANQAAMAATRGSVPVALSPPLSPNERMLLDRIERLERQLGFQKDQ